ncbi:MAG: hypothetical protein JWL89_443 [Candidatus Saccharibacteria bacterium]|jgi:hypothetical protein|nr:hypothetical protein [Candidatus Saccharibacteria bacterium]
MPVQEQIPEQQAIINELQTQVQSPDDAAYLDQLQAEHDAARARILNPAGVAIKAIAHDASGTVLTPNEVKAVQQDGPSEGPYKGGHR